MTLRDMKKITQTLQNIEIPSHIPFPSLILPRLSKPIHRNSVCVRSLPAGSFSETLKSTHQLMGSQPSLSEMPHKQALRSRQKCPIQEIGGKKLISRKALIANQIYSSMLCVRVRVCVYLIQVMSSTVSGS